MGRHTTTMIAVLTLFIVLGGTAVAADKYLVTSTSQIKPSVLEQLRTEAVASAAKAAAKGAKAVVARVGSAGQVEVPTSGAAVSVPLSGGTWTQGATELDEFAAGAITVRQSAHACSSGDGYAVVRISLLLDGSTVLANNDLELNFYGEDSEAIEWSLLNSRSREYPWLAESGHAASHTVTLTATEECGGTEAPTQPATIESVSFDVLGFR